MDHLEQPERDRVPHEPVFAQSYKQKSKKRYRAPLLGLAFGDIEIENRILNLVYTWFLPGFSHSSFDK